MSDENLPFPVTMRGYDRDAVSAHIARLEAEVANAKKAATESAEKAQSATQALEEAQKALGEAEKPTYKGLGARVENLLRSAEEQSSDVLARATTHAQDTVARATVAAPLGSNHQAFARRRTPSSRTRARDARQRRGPRPRCRD